MAVKIPFTEIQNIQQIEIVVAGPEEANRLFIIDGQFDSKLLVNGLDDNNPVTKKEIFTVLVGPVLTSKQFVSANATASIAKTFMSKVAAAAGVNGGWRILNADADWDDESGQVELRIEAEVESVSVGLTLQIDGFAFHVTILAAVPA
jgi:hypothetical protein